VLFDLDETLISDEAATDDALRVTCRPATERHGVEAGSLARAVRHHAGELWRAAPTIGYCRAIGISSWEGLWAGFAGDDPNLAALRSWAPAYRREAWVRALREHGIRDASLAEALAVAFLRERRARHVVFPDAEPALRRLRGRVRLGLLTNGAPDLQREKLEGSGLAPYFEVVLVSGEVGIGKPDPRLFVLALERLGGDPTASAMVGDRLDRDVLGGRRAGLWTVWVNRTGARGSTSLAGDDATPHAEVVSLESLPELLQSWEVLPRDA
jgi:putative hydrolase of the HAD superfamily